MSNCKLDRSLDWLFDSDDDDLKQRVTNHFGSCINYEWYAADCERFLRVIDHSGMTVGEFLKTNWERESDGWEI